MASGLNPKQQRFVDEYLIDLNATRAATRAGYSAATAQEQGSRLLSHAIVAAAIEAAIAKRSQRTEITADRVLNELALLGFSNMNDFMRVNDDGDAVLDFSAMTRDRAAAITELTVEEFKDGRGDMARNVRRTKFKLADKRAALVDIGKHLGMFTERVDMNVKGDMADRLAAGIERVMAAINGK